MQLCCSALGQSNLYCIEPLPRKLSGICYSLCVYTGTPAYVYIQLQDNITMVKKAWLLLYQLIAADWLIYASDITAVLSAKIQND